jgi:metal-sulfur cluster biosynthetic enzyme
MPPIDRPTAGVAVHAPTLPPLIPANAGIQVPATDGDAARIAEVLAALDTALDPELDESVVALGFVAHVAIRGDDAEVDFRLPTFWCSANFAWIMAEDMCAALSRLPWLKHVDVRLVDHFAAGKINRGVAAGQSFRQAFGPEAAASLDALRETFRRKAYLGRMSRLIERLREIGWEDGRIADLTIAGLDEVRTDAADNPMVDRFLELRRLYGGRFTARDRAFVLIEGEPLAAETLPAILRGIRMTRRSVEANGEMCRILLKARMESPPTPREPASSET